MNYTKIVTFLIEKMKLVSFSLFLDASPLDPKCPLDNDMPLCTYTTYVKGVLGLGGKGLYKQKKTSNISSNGRHSGLKIFLSLKRT